METYLNLAMNLSPKPRLKKAFKLTVYIVCSLLLILFLAPYFIPDSFNRRIKEWANESIDGTFDFSTAKFSFFREFPALTLTISDFRLNGSSPFRSDTLISAKELSLGVNVWALISNKVQITLFSLERARVNIKVNERGEANYNIISSKKQASKESSPNDVAVRIKQIKIHNSALIYDDQSTAIRIEANDFNYSGKGDLSAAIFDLSTDVSIKAFDLKYDGVAYIRNKQVAGKLVTRVNTSSLALRFTENTIRINRLPIVFRGSLDFLDKGYLMDFSLRSDHARLLDVFTALPPQYQGWLEETEVRGDADLDVNLKGKYIGNGEQPDLIVQAVIRDGFISNKKAPAPVSNLNLAATLKLPGLDLERMIFDADSLNLTVDHLNLQSVFHSKGFSNPELHTRIKGGLDLALLDRALGIAPVDLKGLVKLDIRADGKFRTGQNPVALRPDTIVLSIPSFAIDASWQDGLMHYTAVPEAIRDISMKLHASCDDSDYRHIKISMDDLKAVAINNVVTGKFHWNVAGKNDVEAELKTRLNCTDLKRFLPDQVTEFKGKIDVNLTSSGIYDPSTKKFPVTSWDLTWQQGQIKTPYYPAAIEDISMVVHLKNSSGDYKDMQGEIEPIQFRFEQQPFRIEASLNDLTDLRYQLKSTGTLELGKIYRVFALDGIGVEGKVQTDLSLAGRQSDMTSARANRLNNSGTIQLENIRVNTNYLPQPVLIDRGIIRFNQDKIDLENIRAKYQSNELTLNGQLASVISYVLDDSGKLLGHLEIEGSRLLLDEFKYYSTSDTTASYSSGTIVLPSNLAMRFDARFKEVQMQGVQLEDFESSAQLEPGRASVSRMQFRLAGGSFKGSATYASTNPSQASFGIEINADSFDIEKAYAQVPMIRTMMPSAATVKGVIGLHYKLAGKLDSTMMPVYPSLHGGGSLTVQQASLKGFKLMNAVSKTTNTEAIRDQDVKKVVINSTIANNLLTIQRTRMKIAGFRPRFEGQVTLDGKYNLSGRLGLPPLGIIGIPFHVGGSQENPVIKLRKGTAQDELQASEVEEEEK